MMLVAYLLWYKQFRSDIGKEGFQFNPYGVCVANRKVVGIHHTAQIHMEYPMINHLGGKVNYIFDVFLNKIYGGYGNVKTMCGNIHEYLGIIFDFSYKYEAKIYMIDYMNKRVENLPIRFNQNGTSPYPETGYLFAVGDSEVLIKDKT